MINFMLLAAFHVHELCGKQSNDSASPFHFWKVCTHFSSMTLVFEFIVVIIFWGFLYQGEVANFPNMDTAQIVAAYMDHSLPLTMLLIDFCLNRIYFEFWHWPINSFILLFYGMVNMTVTLVTGHYVYSILPWDSFVSVVIAVCFVPLYMFMWTFVFYVSKGKFALIGFPKAHNELFQC